MYKYLPIHMTIRHLLYFIKVAEVESVSKAAEALCVAQPSVSQTIKELEHYYNVTLFIRANKKLTLSKEGGILLVKAKDIIESFKSFEEVANQEVNNPKVKIGASITFGIRALPLLLKELKKNIPNIEYSIVIDKTYTLEEKLLKGELDFVLSEGIHQNKNLKSLVFGNDQMYIVAGNEYNIPNKIKLSDLYKYDLLVREENSNPRKHVDYYLALKNIKYTPKMVSVSNNAIMRMVECNEGVALMPMGVCEPYIDKDLVRRIESDTPIKRPLHILYHQDKKLTKVANKAIQISFKFLEAYRKEY